MRGQKQGFRHRDETKKSISVTMKRLGGGPGAKQRVTCSTCGAVMSPPNMKRHQRACSERFRSGMTHLSSQQFKSFRTNLSGHGLSLEQYLKMLKEQGGACKICGAMDRLNVDHCHGSKVVRGLLCNRCNTLLGYARDNSELLRCAAAYVERSSGLARDGWDSFTIEGPLMNGTLRNRIKS